MERMEAANRLKQKAHGPREFMQLPSDEREALMAESAEHMAALLRESGAVEYARVGEMYNALGGVEVLVRREDPLKVVDLLAHKEPIGIDFPPGERYSNAVLWNGNLGERGLQNAYLEGYGGMNNIVAIVGFKPSASFDIQALPDAQKHFAGLDRSLVRSVRGTVAPTEVLFVTLRIPSTAYPEVAMTDAEHEAHERYMERKKAGDSKNPFFLHRGFLFTENLKKQ